jgi:hypothetical protein
MTTTIHLEFEDKAARLPLQSPKRSKVAPAIQRRTAAGAVNNFRIFNAARRVDPKSLSPEDVASDDPELDLSMAGTLADSDLLSTAFVDKTGTVVRDFEEIEVVLKPDGTEKERRPRTDRTANVNDVRPIKVGKLMSVDEALTSFVFRGVYQVVHEDGLGHEFLRALAEKLEKEKSVAVLGAGQKGNQPLVLVDGGSPYRAFLYGETGKEGTYRLLILLSNQELKLPA